MPCLSFKFLENMDIENFFGSWCFYFFYDLFVVLWDVWLYSGWFWKAGERKSINSELWHACAGPLVSLPPVGSLVVYFPQGHSEQVSHFPHSFLRNNCFWIWSAMKFSLINNFFRLQHQCKKRLISYQATLTFLPSWFACSIMSHCM